MTARAAAVIPVRYASVRLPGKPLLDRTGKPLVQHVWEAVSRARLLDPIIVATDDERIAQAARGFGARVELTRADHPSGSDRVAEVAGRLDARWLLNVQGDEPDVDPGDLDRLAQRLIEGGEELVTLAYPLGTGAVGATSGAAEPRADAEAAFRDPHQVKVVVDDAGRALYFSRAPIPHGAPPERALGHLGVYGWRRDALLRFAAAPPADLERHERLEQLRALAMGMTCGVVVTAHRSLGIDTPEDYARFVERQQGAHARGGTA